MIIRKLNNCKNIKLGLVVVNENKKKFILERKDKGEIIVITVDGCLYTDSDRIERCDYAIYALNKLFFIELKGKKLKRGCQQLFKTADIFLKNRLFEEKNYAYLISGSYPKHFKPDEQIWKKKFSKIGVIFYVKNNEFKKIL